MYDDKFLKFIIIYFGVAIVLGLAVAVFFDVIYPFLFG